MVGDIKVKMNTILERLIIRLQEENQELKAINKRLVEENQLFKQEIDKLKERLGLNSSNSSLPPSRDIYKQKKENRPSSSNNPGGQPGHRPYQFKALPANQIIDLLPTKCSCGHEVEVIEQYTREQKIEIPPVQPYVKEYRRYHGRCKRCSKKVVAPLPEGVSKDMLGPHAKAIISSLNGHFHNSRREVQEILEEIFHLPISLGLVNNTAKRVKEKLTKSYQAIERSIQASPYLHIDETGHKSHGKRGWAWMMTNQEASLLKLSPSRGKQVLIDSLGSYSGYVISDRYAVYNHFQEEKQQICWSHLLRDYERFAQSLNSKLSEQGRRLVTIAKEVFCLKKAINKKQIELPYFLRRIKKLKKEIRKVFKFILRIPDIPQAHRVVKRMEKSFEMMWLFVKKQGIAMTNNLAERQIRKYVVYRKKLLFTWSEWGNQFVERMLSLFLTCRLNNSSAFSQLQLAIGS